MTVDGAMLCAVSDAVVNGLIAGGLGLIGAPVGVVVGWWLSRRQQRDADRRLERERQLALMQQLVVAAAELQAAKEIHHRSWFGWRAQQRMWTVTAAECWWAWYSGGKGTEGLPHVVAPFARMLDRWAQGSVDGVAALTALMKRVAEAGLALGMSEDPAIAAAAQRLHDAALEGKGEAEVNAAVAELRRAFYGDGHAGG